MDDCLDFARRLIATPSPSGEEGAAAELVVAEMRRLGFDEAWTDGVGNACGRVFGIDRRAGALVLASHLDQVDPGDPALWTTPPHEPAIRDGRLYGRGAADIKGPLAVQVHALGRLLASNRRPRRDVVVCALVDEEVGGGGAVAWAAAVDYPVDLIVLGEPSDNRLALGHRGIAQLWVTFHGRSAHASAPERAINPNYALASFLQRLPRAAAELPAHELLGPTTVSPTIVKVDTTSPNVTPAWARVLLDFRTAAASPDDLVAFVHRLAGEAPHTVGDCWAADPEAPPAPDSRPVVGFHTPPDHPAVVRSRALVAEGTGREPPLATYRFATDGRHMTALGAAIVGYSPAEEDQAHVADESISLAKMQLSLRGHVALLAGY